MALALLTLTPVALSVPQDPRGACGGSLEARVGGARTYAYADEPRAGTWRTWHVAPGEAHVPPPPGLAESAQERAELHRLALRRTPEQEAAARAWSDGPASLPWERLFLSLVETHSLTDAKQSPPRVARNAAILETATFDALVAAWTAKYCHLRAPPSAMDPTLRPLVDPGTAPAYPSEHAVAAGVASVLFAHFFPGAPAGTFDALAREAAESRLWAGANHRSDVEAGLALGREVARLTLERRADDGSAAVWDGTGRLGGTCAWQGVKPLEPLWGKVRTFVMTGGAQLRPPPPPACDGAQYLAEVEAVRQARHDLTPEQEALAQKWAGNPGSVRPPGYAMQGALAASERHDLGTIRHARMMAHVAAAVADAGIAAWDAKFTYWAHRPDQAVRRLGHEGWTPLLPTPPFPGYVSGHATFSAAGAETLAAFFPEERALFWADAEAAALSRFYGGIHVESDNLVGLELGRGIGRLAAARAASDGAGSV